MALVILTAHLANLSHGQPTPRGLAPGFFRLPVARDKIAFTLGERWRACGSGGRAGPGAGLTKAPLPPKPALQPQFTVVVAVAVLFAGTASKTGELTVAVSVTVLPDL